MLSLNHFVRLYRLRSTKKVAHRIIYVPGLVVMDVKGCTGKTLSPSLTRDHSKLLYINI